MGSGNSKSGKIPPYSQTLVMYVQTLSEFKESILRATASLGVVISR